jgi:hypothetical protein
MDEAPSARWCEGKGKGKEEKGEGPPEEAASRMLGGSI